MQALIENLVKLQSIDLDRARLNQELRALPAEIAQSHTRLAAAERQSAEASAALSREETLRTRLDREIAGHRQKAAKFRTQLDSVTNTEQASAIEHEISFETAEAERLENEEYTSLERTEAQEAALAQSRAQVELLAAELEGVRARVAARRSSGSPLGSRCRLAGPLRPHRRLARHRHRSCRKSAVHRLPHGRAPANLEPTPRGRTAELRQLQPPALL
jgi:predicted  nucleic acid-binding Zn-ribbon protein